MPLRYTESHQSHDGVEGRVMERFVIKEDVPSHTLGGVLYLGRTVERDGMVVRGEREGGKREKRIQTSEENRKELHV